MDIKIKLGKRIRELRVIKGFTQECMSELIGIKPENYCRIENGFSYPKPENIEKICSVLEVNPNDIFAFEHQKEISQIKEELINFIKTDDKLAQLLYKLTLTLKK